MCDQMGQVGVDDDVHASRDGHLTLERQADVLRDLAAAAVGAEQVFRPDLRQLVARAMAHGRGDAIVVLLERHVLGAEPHVAAAGRGRFEQNRLQQGLGQVADARRTGQLVLGAAGGMRAERAHARELLAGQTGAEHLVSHEVLRRGLRHDLALQAHVAEDLDGTLVGDVGARRVRQPPVALQEHIGDAVGAQEQRRRQPRRAGANDDDIGLGRVHGLPLSGGDAAEQVE
jgi:hypothetical protein